VLRPENTSMQPIEVRSDGQILGKVVALVRSY
jgi:SOS-response transcriptional repressor LexA